MIMPCISTYNVRFTVEMFFKTAESVIATLRGFVFISYVEKVLFRIEYLTQSSDFLFWLAVTIHI